jgi:hypothetical protein
MRAGTAATDPVPGEVTTIEDGATAAQADEPPRASAGADAPPVSETPARAPLQKLVAVNDVVPALQSETEPTSAATLPPPDEPKSASGPVAQESALHEQIAAGTAVDAPPGAVAPAPRCAAHIIEVTPNPIAAQQLTLLEGICEGFTLPLMRLQ